MALQPCRYQYFLNGEHIEKILFPNEFRGSSDSTVTSTHSVSSGIGDVYTDTDILIEIKNKEY